MAAEIIMAQVDAATQTSQLLAMSGKTFTVGKVAAAGEGMRNILTLTPTGNAGGAVAIKLEGARQMTDLAVLSGKTVTIAKPSMIAGGASNWLAIQPVSAGAAKASASSATLIKLEGTRQGMQAASLTGQKFTIAQPMMAGKGAGSTLFLQPAGGGDLVALKMANAAPTVSSMVGKSVTIVKAPLIAGGKTGTSWLAIQPTAAATTAKLASGASVATATSVGSGTVQAKTIAMTTPLAPKAAVTAGSAVKGSGMGLAAATKSGSIWKGTGAGLGLGLGLGIWGPVIVAGVGVAAIYGYVRVNRSKEEA